MKTLENAGVDPAAPRMPSERSAAWADSPSVVPPEGRF